MNEFLFQNFLSVVIHTNNAVYFLSVATVTGWLQKWKTRFDLKFFFERKDNISNKFLTLYIYHFHCLIKAAKIIDFVTTFAVVIFSFT